MTKTLDELRADIQREAANVGKRPYSHNLIRLALEIIDKRFGRAEANKAVRDFRLKRKGFNEEPD